MGSPAGAAALLSGALETAADGSLLFPPLPGLTLEYVQRPTFSTIVQTGADRSTTRIQLDPYPLWEYDLVFGYLSDDPFFSIPISATNPMGLTQLQQFLGLFCACGGRRTTFLLDIARFTRRASDSFVEGIAIGTGDGATTAFQLLRNLGGFLDLIDNPIVGTVEIIVAPTSGAPYEATATSIVNGLATLSAAPPNGATITATFKWLHRMRFVNDEEDVDGLLYQLHSKGNLKLVQERNHS